MFQAIPSFWLGFGSFKKKILVIYVKLEML